MENKNIVKNIFGSYVMNMMIKSAEEKRNDVKGKENELLQFEIIEDYIEQA